MIRHLRPTDPPVERAAQGSFVKTFRNKLLNISKVRFIPSSPTFASDPRTMTP